MDRLLGIPVEALSLSLLVMVAAAFGLIAVLAVRNRVFFRLGTRNVRRRKGRSALIVGGLMLATAIISSALTTGDTMGYTIRSSVLRALGPTDVRVSVAGADLDPALDVSGRMPTPAFDEDVAAQVVDAALALPAVDGAAAAIVDNAGAQNLNRRLTEPRVTVYGADASRSPEFGTVVGSDGTEKTLSDLIPKRVYANRQAADDLGARPGDVIALFAGSSSTPVTVDDVVEFRGAGEDGPAVLMPLDAAQQILGLDGQVHHVLVSNAGDEESGATRTDEVMADLAPAVAPLGLEVDPVKQDGLDVAEEQGNAFMSLFSIFGTFSIAAGILLIFLIFVMLSAERRGEMGIARAVGTQRGHLVQMFVFEGAVYDVLAAAVGSLLGLGIAAVMVEVVGSAFSTEGVAIEHHVRLQSLAAAYGIGVVLTLVVVAFSAWRVSVLDIVSAIRNLPTPIVRKARRSHWLRGAAGVALGGTMAAAGAGAGQGTPFLLGASIVLVSLVPIARALGIGDRTAYTMAGVLLVAWWLLPMRLVESVVGDLSSDFSIWIVAGLMVVLGATWTLMYNADLVLAGVTRVAGRFRPVAPIARMAVAYPLRSRLRTAMTLAMFMLVVYTLVTGTAISGSFISSFDDEEAFGGGFDVRAVAAPVAPIPDPEAAFERVLPDGSVEAVGSQSLVPTEVRQAGAGQEFADYPLRGLDEGFLTATTFDLGARARGFESDEAVWEAVAGEPRLAVVDSFVVPRRDNFNFGAVTDLKLEGFVYEDRVFDPVDLEIHDPATGERFTVTVVGVLADSAPFEMAGVSVAQETLAPLGARAVATTHYVQMTPGADAVAAAEELEAAFLPRGLEAEAVSDLLAEAVGQSWTVNRLIQGFLGLGLVVGVVALGVVSARSVVERRQQIGVLRAIGFQPSMVRLSFLAEASFISLLAIGAGTTLGLITAFNVVQDVGANDNVPFTVPWLNLAVIFAAVYLAALASTLLPALRGSRVYPAEALRYE